jgi:hypothetical protein
MAFTVAPVRSSPDVDFTTPPRLLVVTCAILPELTSTNATKTKHLMSLFIISEFYLKLICLPVIQFL